MHWNNIDDTKTDEEETQLETRLPGSREGFWLDGERMWQIYVHKQQTPLPVHAPLFIKSISSIK